MQIDQEERVSVPREATVVLRRMTEEDIPRVVELAIEHFAGFREDPAGADEWIRACHRGYPRSQYFVIVVDGRVEAYILWTFHGGPRTESVLELDQVATSEWSRAVKLELGTRILASLDAVRDYLASRGRVLKMVFIFTRDVDGAAGFYQKAFAARQVCVIPDMYRGNEAVLVRNFLKGADRNGASS